ncbi:hypothetical protein B0T24DRAFT_161027 [Lasiosphaeria ovina]|uniref:Uncharacterized protein n=1 Tax=Lasiosphaeria ovina TaxID=92902 RepID=A0AAE0KN63_9PEZI|nr:hypothetical protein B0T24DRAFT_161027 [Lasiosphaeria ovina]
MLNLIFSLSVLFAALQWIAEVLFSRNRKRENFGLSQGHIRAGLAVFASLLAGLDGQDSRGVLRAGFLACIMSQAEFLSFFFLWDSSTRRDDGRVRGSGLQRLACSMGFREDGQKPGAADGPLKCCASIPGDCNLSRSRSSAFGGGRPDWLTLSRTCPFLFHTPILSLPSRLWSPCLSSIIHQNQSNRRKSLYSRPN